MIATTVLYTTVAAWFSLEAESTNRRKSFWIVVEPTVFTLLFIVKSLVSGANPISGTLVEVTSHAIGLLVASLVSWQLPKRSGLEIRHSVRFPVLTQESKLHSSCDDMQISKTINNHGTELCNVTIISIRSQRAVEKNTLVSARPFAIPNDY